MNTFVAAKVIWSAGLKTHRLLSEEWEWGQIVERETPPDGNQQSTNTACGGMIHNPRADRRLNWTDLIQQKKLSLFCSIFSDVFMIKSEKRAAEKRFF